MYKVNRFTVILIFFVFIFGSCATTGSSNKKNTKEPAWVMNPRTVFDENKSVFAVGSGLTKDLAEKSAYTNLGAIFGQRIQGETTTNERYTEALSKGKLTVSEDSELFKSITTTVDMDILIGAEIREQWFDGNRTYYAVAVMERSKAVILYSNIIDQNETTIKTLTNIPSDEKTTLDAYARYDFANSIASANEGLLNVLTVLNPANGMAKKQSITPSADLRLECIKIAEVVPINVVIENDSDGRIEAAFKNVLSKQGFKVGDSSSPYSVFGSIALSPVSLANNENKFSRYIVDAKLVDSNTNKLLVPFSIDGREGHATQEEANNRAIRKAVQRIEVEFQTTFNDYLTQLTD